MENKKDSPNKKYKRSLIMKYFDKDLYLELTKVTMMHDIDNNGKGTIIKQLLSEHNIPFTSLGSGTNRMAVLIDGYAVKFALDRDGQIDNRREMLYTRDLQPYVIKVYECVPSGLVAVTEYVSPFNLDDFYKRQQEMKEILSDISGRFLIGDVGITNKNYGNWGERNDGTICILDFAYIYSVQYRLFTCNCEAEGLLEYDNDYNKLRCPYCGRSYSFGEIRKKITKAKQEMEIGDIRRLGYNLTEPEELVEPIPEFEPEDKTKKKKKELSEVQKIIKENEKRLREENSGSKESVDYWSRDEDDYDI